VPKRQPDVRKLAIRQRWLVWMVLLSIVMQALPFVLDAYFSPSAGARLLYMIAIFAQFAALLLVAVGAIFIMLADGTHVVVIVLAAILLFAPCGGILILLLINRRATRLLRAAGLRVGLMGVNPDEVERILDPNLCTTCGYNLTGNLSGLCPECGTPLPLTPPTVPQ